MPTLKENIQANITQAIAVLENTKGILLSAISAGEAAITPIIEELNNNIELIESPEECVMPQKILRTGAPDQLAVNYYPHSIEFYEGYYYLTTVGVDNLSPPPYTAGNTKLVKIDPKTRTVVGQCDGGAYKAPGLGNGMNGFCIHAGKAYVCNNHYIAGTTEVMIIDLATMTIEAVVPLGSGASRHCVYDGQKLWATVADGTEFLKRIDLTTNTIDLSINLPGDKPFRLAFFADSVWLACFNSNKVKRFNKTTGALEATLNVSAAPNWFGWDDTGLYVACYNGQNVHKIDPSNNTSVIACTLAAGDCPHHPFPYLNEIWVACSGSHKIKIFDRTSGSLKKTIAVPQNPPSIACDGTAMAHGCGNVGLVKFHPLDFYFQS